MHAEENDAEYFTLAQILEKMLACFFYNETTHLQSLSLIYQSIYFMNDEVLIRSGIRTLLHSLFIFKWRKQRTDMHEEIRGSVNHLQTFISGRFGKMFILSKKKKREV